MDSESSQQFCLRWHNHQSSVLGGLPALLDSGRLTDVTLCAGGRSLRAHRIVLSTCSSYFMDIFKDLPATQQPVVVILGGGWAELCCLVAFMYAGEVTLPRSLLPGLLRLARALRITGLTDLNGNIPDVPQQSEYDDSFNTKFESTFEEMKLSRQNSDSATSYTENIYPFQRTCENFSPPKKCEAFTSQDQNLSNTMQDNSFQELHLLRQLSKTFSDNEKSTNLKDDLLTDGDGNVSYNSSGMVTRGRKSTKTNKANKYMNPVLNEIEPKNRKIDKIVENLKCNQMRTQEIGSIHNSDISQIIDNQDYFSTKLNITEKVGNVRKLITSDVILPTSNKVADIFASNNIFMETDTDNVCCDQSSEMAQTAVKTEPDSSPEILSDLKFIPLSPGIQSMSPQTPTNTKLYATCYVCHKRLSNQYNLRVHLETHQNARHACVACNHVSRSRDALRKHVSYRHPQLNTSHGVGRPCKSNQNSLITNTSPNIAQSSHNITQNVFNFPNIGNISEPLSSNPNMSKNSSKSGLYGNLDQSNSSQGGSSSANKSEDAKKSGADQSF